VQNCLPIQTNLKKTVDHFCPHFIHSLTPFATADLHMAAPVRKLFLKTKSNADIYDRSVFHFLNGIRAKRIIG
jgi:hypothetical protein